MSKCQQCGKNAHWWGGVSGWVENGVFQHSHLSGASPESSLRFCGDKCWCAFWREHKSRNPNAYAVNMEGLGLERAKTVRIPFTGPVTGPGELEQLFNHPGETAVCVVRWLKREGQTAFKDEAIAKIRTTGVPPNINVFNNGPPVVLQRILVPEGRCVPGDEALALVVDLEEHKQAETEAERARKAALEQQLRPIMLTLIQHEGNKQLPDEHHPHWHFIRAEALLVACGWDGKLKQSVFDTGFPKTRWVEEDPVWSPLHRLRPYSPSYGTPPAPLEEASEAYTKAIALGVLTTPMKLAEAKLMRAKLASVLDLPDMKYYAREAEKDLRKHLRKQPDDITALTMLGDSLHLSKPEYSGGRQTERMLGVLARIQEANIRRDAGQQAPARLPPPGSPESSYPDDWQERSQRIRERDGFRCTECGASGVELQVHHVIPISQGGSHESDNLTTLCDLCHKDIHPHLNW